MGLIQFAKGVGRRLAVGDTPLAQSAQAPVAGPGSELQKAGALVRLVEQLGIQVDGRRVTLTGTTDRQKSREKVVLLIGNVHGVGQADDQLPVAQPAPEARFYNVGRGVTLSKIAQAYYGDATQYPHLFEANQPLLRDPPRNLPGPDTPHPSINETEASRDHLSTRRVSHTWRTT